MRKGKWHLTGIGFPPSPFVFSTREFELPKAKFDLQLPGNHYDYIATAINLVLHPPKPIVLVN